MNKKILKDNGLTLIALVITIILMLIITSCSISLLTGQNGIINRTIDAKQAVEETNDAERKNLAKLEAQMNENETEYEGIKIPAGFAPTKINGETKVNGGLVITDSLGNEYVWVEVPKSIYDDVSYNDNGNKKPNVTTEYSEEDYTNIEYCLNQYSKTYTEPIDIYAKDEINKDKWLTEEEYYKKKKKMLKSIYENGGFWIGRYETGIDTSESFRTKENTTNMQTPVVKKNAYPYNWVTRTEAQFLANSVETKDYTCSLLFGVQWNLTLKFIEEKTVEKNNMSNIEIRTILKNNSESIGNFNNTLWKIQSQVAKYSIDKGNSYQKCPKIKTQEQNILLTTGADDSFALLNIYDIAGNLFEWTMESREENPCVCAGGSFIHSGVESMANSRYADSVEFKIYDVGFRFTLY